MEHCRDTEKLFIGRYIDFWSYFNPGRSIPAGLGDVARRYYQDLLSENIDFKTFDRICKAIEKDFTTLGYDFNLTGYVIDCVKSEKLAKSQNEDVFYRREIKIPENREPVIAANHAVFNVIEDLKKRGFHKWVSLLERINANRKESHDQYEYIQCEACRDSGWVSLPGNTAATCTCHRGQKIRDISGKKIDLGIHNGKHQVVREATPEERKTSARNEVPYIPYEQIYAQAIGGSHIDKSTSVPF